MRNIPTRIMICFSLWVLWMLRFELTIAERYSSNRKYINQLRDDVLKWERDIYLLEVNHGRS
jgi:hypothetical protein